MNKNNILIQNNRKIIDMKGSLVTPHDYIFLLYILMYRMLYFYD